jgi:hypothetical protein
MGVAVNADPPPIPPERHEEISRVQLAVAWAQIRVLVLREADSVNMDDLRAAERALVASRAAYRRMLEALRREFSVGDACELAVDKSWICPSAPAK